MELWHIVYKGVDGRKIFMDDQDRARFVHDLYEFNDTKPADIYDRTPAARGALSQPHVGRGTSYMRERLIDLHGWKLMPNHVHLILSERREEGRLSFLRKMTGYGRYFNERHERKGSLFERTKKVPITQLAHFLYVLHYVHLNGLDDFLGAKNWRERDRGTVADINAAIEHLKADKWSSFRDYCGIKNFPSILTKGPFEQGSAAYLDSVRAYLKDREDESLDRYRLE